MMWLSIVRCLTWYATSRVLAQQIAAPLIFAPTDEWLGNDGPWSVFSLEIGTPAQRISVLPGSSYTAVYSVIDRGCENLFPNGTECAQLRGGLYAGNESVTWEGIGIYNANTDFVNFNGLYGWDSVALGSVGSGPPSVNHTVVSQIAATAQWLGLFGISPQSTNFSTFNDLQPTFFTMLRSGEWIASRTWSYTAGSVNRQTPASLIFGGFDASLLDSGHSVSTSFSADVVRELSLEVTSISTSTASSSNTHLWSRNMSAVIDSAVAQLWLPLDACQAFEQEFGLVWDEDSELYLVDDRLHDLLVVKDPSVHFDVQGTDGPTKLTLSHSSFDLKVGWPLIGCGNFSNITQRYFPLKRAANETQYALGRAFLQETYVIADYDRRILNVSQAKFGSAASRVYTITPPTNSSSGNASEPDPPTTQSIGGGSIAGIAVGVVAALALAYLLFARLKKHWPFGKGHNPVGETKDEHGKAELDGTAKPFAEAPADQQVSEMSGAGRPHESNARMEKFELADGTDDHAKRHEKPAEILVHELPTGDQNR